MVPCTIADMLDLGPRVCVGCSWCRRCCVWQVLIVEDDPQMRAFFSASIAGSAQLSLAAAVSSVAAAKAWLDAPAWHVDVLLVDLGLPDGSGLEVIRHTEIPQKTLTTIALCGGAGSFLTKTALAAGADAYVTADIKYHEFFDAENRLLLADIGHWESEQYTIDLLVHILQAKFPTFAVLQSRVRTNPVYYYS